jgi:hypothetical protein
MPAKAGIQNLGRATQNIVIAQSAKVRRKSPANAGRLPPSLAETSTDSADRRQHVVGWVSEALPIASGLASSDTVAISRVGTLKKAGKFLVGQRWKAQSDG